MKKITLFFFITTVMFQLACRHGHKTYPDLSGQWAFSYPILDHIDTAHSKLSFSFLPYPEHSVSVGFLIEKLNDSNTMYKIVSGYMEKNNISGTYFQTRIARFNQSTDSISFSIFENSYGDSIGIFTCKYDKKKDELKGKFYTFYQMYCFCPYAGKKLQYIHEVTAPR